MDKEAISRRDLLKIAGVSMGTLALSSYGAIAQQIPEMERPNIIFIISDDHAFHAMSCYSSGMNKTPNLQRDPHELSNVIGDPSYEDIRVELTTELYRLKSYYGDDRE